MDCFKNQEDIENIDNFIYKKSCSLQINNILADYYLNKEKNRRKFLRIKNCASYLLFRNYFDPENTRKFISANFCKHPMCMMCAWRLHLKKVFILQKALDMLKKDYPDINLYFLNLTVRNWDIMTNFRLRKLEKKVVRFIRKILGITDYYCSLEITISKLEELPYHPHMHCIVSTTKELGTCLSDLHDLRCIWAKVYGEKEYSFLELTLYPIRENSVNEVTKYILKPEREVTSKHVISIAKAVKGVKKTFSAGKIKEYVKKAEQEIKAEKGTILDELTLYGFLDEFYKWTNNTYLLQNFEK